MRKTIALLAALISLAAAGTASADVPVSSQQIITTYPNANLTKISCATNGTYGSWIPSLVGYYHDGCTTPLLRCTSIYGCDAASLTAINRSTASPAFNVSQNARIRIYNSAGAVVRFHDKSCFAAGRCETRDMMTLNNGEYASVQCNGVHYDPLGKPYYNYCGLDLYKVH
jgi:hypothetical protein